MKGFEMLGFSHQESLSERVRSGIQTSTIGETNEIGVCSHYSKHAL